MPINFDDYIGDEDIREPLSPSPAPEKKKEESPQRERVPDDGTEYDDDFIVTNRQRRRRRLLRGGALAAAVIVVSLLAHYLFFAKTVSRGRARGYVVELELKKKFLFNSYECKLVIDYPDSYGGPDDMVLRFSATDQRVGERLFSAMAGDSVVVVDYVVYANRMPWRGETRTVVSGMEVVPPTPLSRTPERVEADHPHHPKKDSGDEKKK